MVVSNREDQERFHIEDDVSPQGRGAEGLPSGHRRQPKAKRWERNRKKNIVL